MILSKFIMRALPAIAAILLIVPACKPEKGTAPDVNRELAPASLAAKLDPGEAAIGDRIIYTLSLSRIPDIIAELPEFSDKV